MSKSRGAKREHHEEHEEHVNHEAWVIPYADMLTLLMALFLVMFAMGRTDNEKFEAVSESLRANFGGPRLVSLGSGVGASPIDGGLGILDTIVAAAAAAGEGTDEHGVGDPPVTLPAISPAPEPQVVHLPPTDADVALAMQQEAYTVAEEAYTELAALEALVQSHADASGIGHALDFRLEARGLVVTIVTDQVLFADGRAEIQPAGVEVLAIVADALLPRTNLVAIEGHTDSRPIATTRFPSNWELSTARATSVLRYLVDRNGFDPDRLSAAGYADTRPVAPNDTVDGAARNRRVEVVVLSSVSLDPILGN